MSEPLDVFTIEGHDNYRVAVYHDADAGNPRTEWDSEPGRMFYTLGESDHVHPDGAPTELEDFYRELRSRCNGMRWEGPGRSYRWRDDLDEDALFERYLRIRYGRGVVATGDIDRGGSVLVYATKQDIDDLGWAGASDDEIRESLSAAIETYRMWANGEVVIVTLEERVRYMREDGDDVIVRWETVDSLGDCYLTTDRAGEALDVAREMEGWPA